MLEYVSAAQSESCHGLGRQTVLELPLSLQAYARLPDPWFVCALVPALLSACAPVCARGCAGGGIWFGGERYELLQPVRVAQARFAPPICRHGSACACCLSLLSSLPHPLRLSLSLCLSLSLPFPLPLSLSLSLCLSLSLPLSASLFLSLSLCLSVCLSLCLSLS